MKLFGIIFVFLILSLVQTEDSISELACSSDWIPYKDEKCYTILESSTPNSYDEAEKNCVDSGATLPIIHSSDEQAFLVYYLANNTSNGGKVSDDNFWIGAKVRNGAFSWNDNSRMSSINFNFSGIAIRNTTTYCVRMPSNVIGGNSQMTGHFALEECHKPSGLVVCQRKQFWTIDYVQKAFLKLRSEQTWGKCFQLERNVVELTKKVEEANRRIEELSRRLERLRN